jgi:hypothetical protein
VLEESVAEKGILTDIPRIVEKSVFQNALKVIPDGKAKTKVQCYYKIMDLNNGEFYVFDRHATDREIEEILAYWNEYIGWSDRYYNEMLFAYNLFNSDYLKPVPPVVHNYGSNNYDYSRVDIDEIERDFALRDPELYSHVRFGENKNTLLLILEWHTPESYAEEIEKWQNQITINRQSEWYMQASEEEKEAYENSWKNHTVRKEEILQEIIDGTSIETKSVNGNSSNGFGFSNGNGIPMNKNSYLNKDGYYEYQIYPYHFFFRELHTVYSKQEFDELLENEIIPYMDGLLKQGAITQEHYENYYDSVAKDPFDAEIERFFGKADR